MSNFGEKLYTPVPLYTEENVRDAIAYIDERQKLPSARVFKIELAQVFKTALLYVQSQLAGSPFKGNENDMELIGKAWQGAAYECDRARQAKELVAVVRWWYVMAALSDYRQYLISKEAVT